MEIITRKIARENNLKSYFTGERCRNGHLSYRYTQSGVCADCLRVGRGSPVDKNVITRRQARANLSTFRFRIPDRDYDLFIASVWAFAAARAPELLLEDVTTDNAPSDCNGGTGLYLVRCHTGDVDALRVVAAGILSTYSASFPIAEARAKAFTESVKYIK